MVDGEEEVEGRMGRGNRWGMGGKRVLRAGTRSGRRTRGEGGAQGREGALGRKREIGGEGGTRRRREALRRRREALRRRGEHYTRGIWRGYRGQGVTIKSQRGIKGEAA